jgi:hypothetical protein
VASRHVFASAIAVVVLAAAACDGVLGMNAPTLALVADGSIDDAEIEAGRDDGAPEAAADTGAVGVDSGVHHDASAGDAATDASHHDAGDAASVGIRCGGGSATESWCNPQTQVCCQGGTVSAPTFMCVASGTCLGYNILCANYNDCNNSEICCRFVAHQICDAPTSCPNSEVVCDQATTDACNAGQKCDVPFVGDAAAASPYLGCGP